MSDRSRRNVRAWVITAGLAIAAPACDGDHGAGVTGVLTTAERDIEAYGSIVHVRAVPDHIDGFEPNRPYTGPRVMEASCPLEHTTFPVDYLLMGDYADVDGAPPRWRLLAWISDDEDATWVQPGQLYGTTAFEFSHGSRSSSWADYVSVELDQFYR